MQRRTSLVEMRCSRATTRCLLTVHLYRCLRLHQACSCSYSLHLAMLLTTDSSRWMDLWTPFPPGFACELELELVVAIRASSLPPSPLLLRPPPPYSFVWHSSSCWSRFGDSPLYRRVYGRVYGSRSLSQCVVDEPCTLYAPEWMRLSRARVENCSNQLATGYGYWIV